MRLRALLPLLALAFLAAFAGKAWAGPGRLYVFHPSLARPLAIQEALSRKCPGLAITVFGRLTEFQAKVAQDSPEAILALPPVLRQYPAYRPRLTGTRKGRDTEPYVLLSLEKPADPAKMEGVSLGVVGLLERKPMADFVHGLVKGAPRLDRVTKLEDLLPLLTFRAVSAVLVPEAIAAEFGRKSQAALATAKLPVEVGLAAVAIRKDAEEGPVAEALRRLGAEELELLGVDAWK